MNENIKSEINASFEDIIAKCFVELLSHNEPQQLGIIASLFAFSLASLFKDFDFGDLETE